MKIVFFGTPQIAVDCLSEILKSHHEVLAVVTNLDKPAGRGKKILPNPIKSFALENNLKLLQYNKIGHEAISQIKKLEPAALVLVAFGQILSPEVLDIALPINLHGSLLPKLRGPSPIQSAILNGLTETGVTVMKMEPELDAGPILLQEKVEILPTDTSGTLFTKMGAVGGKALVRALDYIQSGQGFFTPQNDAEATFTTKLTKEEAKIDFNTNSVDIVNKIRAYNPNPVAYFDYHFERIRVYAARVVDGTGKFTPGTIVKASNKDGLIIKTKDGFIEILELQAPNSNHMAAKNFLNGSKFQVGVVL